MAGSLIPFLLIGWVVAIYFLKKKDKIAGGMIGLVWFAIFIRLNILFLVVQWLIEISPEKFSTNFAWIAFRWLSDFIVSSMVLFVPILIILIAYFAFKKQFKYAILAILLLFPAHFSYMESYFLFYPLIDTMKSSKFTLKNFEKIKPGMTRDQVQELIGYPIKDAGQYHAPCEGQTGDNAAPYPYDFAWLNSSVCYDEFDKVTETKKMWIPD